MTSRLIDQECIKSPFEKGGFRQQCPVWFLHKEAARHKSSIVQQFIKTLTHFLLREDYFPLTLTLSPIGGEGIK